MARRAAAVHASAMSTPSPSQMQILSESECWKLMRGCEVGRLGISIMNQPDIFPVNFVVDVDTIVFRTAEGTKLAAAVLGRGVAFEVDGYDSRAGEAWSVVAKGEAVEIEEMYELFAAEDLPLFPWHVSPKLCFVRINPDVITGRRFVVDQTALRHAEPATSPGIA